MPPFFLGISFNGDGTSLATSPVVQTSPAVQSYACHWDYIPGPSDGGRPVRTMMWICEYPYRTMRPSGPNDDCTDCPLWTELKKRRDEQEPETADDPANHPIAS